jgi:hypothetical protein
MTEALLRQVSQKAQSEIEERLKSEREKSDIEMKRRLAESQAQAAIQEKKAIEDALSVQKQGLERETELQKQREIRSQEEADRLVKQMEELQKKNQELTEGQRLAHIKAQDAAQQRIQEVTAEIEQKLKLGADLKIRELELKLGTVQGKLEEASRKASQGSMQNQGAALEASFEDQLAATFSRDKVSDVRTGEKGGDVMLDVFNDVGTCCGRILFETKRTQNWSNSWIGKLHEDTHRVRAHVAVIVTQQLPKDIQGCGLKDGVWVTDFASAMPLIRSLRWGLIQVQLEKKVQQNAEQNASLLYAYVTSPEFRNRVVSIVGAHAGLRDGINKERKAMEKNWKLRETQIGIVEQNIMAMLGSIEGNSGHHLEGVGDLELEDGEESLIEDAA